MLDENGTKHIYHRVIVDASQDSLSVIAGLIGPGQTVLDLGMGTGGLGQFLSQRHAFVVDGVTLSPQEAQIAQPWYRRALVADLDRDRLKAIFGDQQYDCIVCADVLEHLKAPQTLLTQCKALLTPGGQLISCVPNAGYCGLVAELITGDFRYRSEGLLDSTHLRFFTRTSLQRFFVESGWATQSVATIQRNLAASEFKVAFDGLPPSVARHLLALPDALSYQFISVLQPVEMADRPVSNASSGSAVQMKPTESASALFSAQLYLAVQNRYDEATKLVTSGRIGEHRQTLGFDIPASPRPYSGIRFDPADRPGFFRLHHLCLWLPGGEPAWQWHDGSDPLTALANATHNQIAFSPPSEMASGTLLLLHGDDPSIELPLDLRVLEQVALHGARLEVCADWPMSADYLQASTTINEMQTAHQQESARLQQELDQLRQQLAHAENSRVEIQAELAALGPAAREAKVEKQHLLSAPGAPQRERKILQSTCAQSGPTTQTIARSIVLSATRPLSKVKKRLHLLLGQRAKKETNPAHNPRSRPKQHPKHCVDIVVPVYCGLEHTKLCLESVLAASCQTTWRLIIINDYSPEPEITEWLRLFAQRDAPILLLENSENLGFVASVNRGMAQSTVNDVLLLNSDTEVTNDWLDRLQRAAYSAPMVASVTPFSNNATIFSYPRFCHANELPAGYNAASLDQLFAQHLAGQTIEVPTGMGFCMYLRRQSLQEVGSFDVANFGKGYGEENDFCIMAQHAGWTHLHALDTFVRHAGGISFGDTKSEREIAAMETLRRLHPHYEALVEDYLKRDPARAARQKIDIVRLAARIVPVILIVTHNREGGTLRHIRELIQKLERQATFLRLIPRPGGAELRLDDPSEAIALQFALPDDHPQLLQTLREFRVDHIHYHHLLDHAHDISNLATDLGVSHDFTAHDYYSYCPQISLTDPYGRYCGEQGIAQCHQCLQLRPAPGGESIEDWRARHARLLGQARFLITPSFDVAQRMQRFVPDAHLQVVPHSTLYRQIEQHPKPRPRVLGDDERLRIVVLGALSRIKGADTLEETATLAAIHNLDLEFHLVGYPYRDLRALPRGFLTVHGGYEEEDLLPLLRSVQADVVWFPALWPETYSYTLSASLEAGLPIIAPDLGAFAERLQDRDWTWLAPWYQSASQWLEFFKVIRRDHFCCGVSPSPISLATPRPIQDAGASSAQMNYQEDYLYLKPKRSARLT